MRWLKWTSDKADWIDPLTAKEDELLGKARYLFENIDLVFFIKRMYEKGGSSSDRSS